MHDVAHPLAGLTVTIKNGELAGREIIVEDWFERCFGTTLKTWHDAAEAGNNAAMTYMVRFNRASNEAMQRSHVNDVVYGKFPSVLLPAGVIVHNWELGHEYESTQSVPNDDEQACMLTHIRQSKAAVHATLITYLHAVGHLPRSDKHRKVEQLGSLARKWFMDAADRGFTQEEVTTAFALGLSSIIASEQTFVSGSLSSLLRSLLGG